VLKSAQVRADQRGVELETMVSRMEHLGWTWEPSTRTFGRVNGLRLTMDIAAEHLAELDRLDRPPGRPPRATAGHGPGLPGA
jgi:hypothetical protein